jgi:hypothetical protein
MHGLYSALIEGRFFFDFVHEDDLGPETLKKYTALILPNVALLSDAQCAQLKAYADAGGSLLATFETSLYNEQNERRTDEPVVVIRDKGQSRFVYFPGDVERTLWRSGNTDLGRLLENSIRWVLRGESPVSIEGDGVIEAFAWETEAGFSVHVLNYTNPAMHKGWIRRFYPIGAQKVRIQLPSGRRVSRVELLHAEAAVPHKQQSGVVEFVIPKIDDYEVAALVTARPE